MSIRNYPHVLLAAAGFASSAVGIGAYKLYNYSFDRSMYQIERREAQYKRWLYRYGADRANQWKRLADKPLVEYVINVKLEPAEYLRGRLMSGEDFARLYPGVLAVKMVHKRRKHHGIIYKNLGEYQDYIPLYACNSCAPGGLYFMLENDLEYAKRAQSREDMLNEHIMFRVHVPNDALVYFDDNAPRKYKADKFELVEVLGDYTQYMATHV